MRKYIVVAMHRQTHAMVQVSNSCTWAECESVYEEFCNTYDTCEILIMCKGIE